MWAAVSKALDAAASAADPERQRRLATVVVGGGAGVELAEMLPDMASGRGLAAELPAVQLLEAGPDHPGRLVADSGLPTGHNGRVKVDRYLRVLEHPEIYVVGGLQLGRGGAPC